MFKFLKNLFKRDADFEKKKQKYARACKHISENLDSEIKKKKAELKQELTESEKRANILYEDKLLQAQKIVDNMLHSAQCRAQEIMTKAAKYGDAMTVEMYKKDIYGRPFVRMVPLLDPEGYEHLKDGTGYMKFKIIYPDGSRQTVRAIPYNG